MRVKELIRDTVWMPGRSYDASKKPKVSVLLPTFRRGKSGLFQRCVESLLAQTLEDIEIIIIDDASTDGTADQIREFQDLDGRVSCLRHTRNVGLPAVSEYEGFLKARADMFAFAFDDTFFNEDAIEKLLKEAEAAPHAVVWGHIEWSYKDAATGEIVTSRLGMEQSQGLLRLGNFIPNSAVLMRRHIIEDVGFYDPHVGMARVCDWDLWCRIAERYEMKFVDVAIGLEGGPLTGDSLGKTYALDHAAASEWMRLERNEKLRPQNIENFDVFELDPRLGISTLTVFDCVARKHAAARKLLPPKSVTTDDPDGYILLLLTHYDASTTLCFEMLPPTIAKRIRLMGASSGFGYEEMARATCVVFVRSIAALRPWIDAAQAMGVPAYYYLDDNLPLLQSKKEFEDRNEDFSLTQFSENMRLFEGVLLTSRNLVSYFQDRFFHDNLIYFPIAFHDQAPLSTDYREEKRPGETVMACMGGSHRSKGLREALFPAIRKIAEGGRLVHLVVVKGGLDRIPLDLPDTLRITEVPFDVGYLFALRRFARFSPDIIVHPPSDTVNSSYKTLNPLVSAELLGCVLVAPEMEPYTQVASEQMMVLVKDPEKPVSWYRALSSLLSGEIDAGEIRSRTSAYCREHFSGTENEDILRSMLRKHGGEVPWHEQSQRLYRLFSWARVNVGMPSLQSHAGLLEQNVKLISDYRKMVRYSWRHRIKKGPTDLWDMVDHRYASLKACSQMNRWRRRGAPLELSDSLSEIPYREYSVTPPSGKLKAVLFAVSVDIVQLGTVGVEVVGPDNEIKDHVVVDLQRANLAEPLKFELSNVNVNENGIWKIRIFAKSNIAVYVLEFVNRRFFGLRFSDPTPFMNLVIE